MGKTLFCLVSALLVTNFTYAMNVPQHSPTTYQNGVHYDGDVNYDFVVNIADLCSVIDLILNDTDVADVNPLADVNFDGEINIADVNELIDIILGEDGFRSNIHEYGDDQSNEGRVLSVTDSMIVIKSTSGKMPEPGEIIVCGIAENAPDGFLRHVKSSQKNGDNIEIITYDAALEEVIPNGSYNIPIPFGDESETGPIRVPGKKPQKVTLKSEIKFNIYIGWDKKTDKLVFKKDTVVSDSIQEQVLTGQEDTIYPVRIIVKITPSRSLNFICDKHQNKIIRQGVSGNFKVSVEVLGKMSFLKSFSQRIVLGDFWGQPCVIHLGALPFVFRPSLRIYLTPKFNCEAFIQGRIFRFETEGESSYILNSEPDPITGQKNNFYSNFSTSCSGFGNPSDYMNGTFASKIGLNGSLSLTYTIEPAVTLYELLKVELPISPWVKAVGNLVLPISNNAETFTEVASDNQLNLTAGLDVGVNALLTLATNEKTLYEKKLFDKKIAVLESEPISAIGITPYFEDLMVFPDEGSVPTSTEQICFSMYMTKPLLQLLSEKDYGFAYGFEDDSTYESWQFISLKDEYDEDFTIGNRKQYIETYINTSEMLIDTSYKVCPYVKYFETNVLMKGKEFRITEHFDDFMVSENSIKTYPQKIEAIEIIGGSGQYSVSSNNESVAIATISSHHVNVETTGIGTATITVMDDNNPGCSLPIVVTVVPYPKIQTYHVNGVSFKMVEVEGGSFTMGATAEQGSEAESQEFPTHRVTLSDFSIGETEVTQELWKAVMGSNPSRFSGNLKRPVERVTLEDCQTFINKLNDLTGELFHLPTEAEWEYAARGGNMSRHYKYAGSNSVDDVAWYDANASDVGSSSPDYGTHTVALKAPNELGLFDMSGNVWELCQDRYGSYSDEDQFNPKGPESGSKRVIRGGGWVAFAKSCRVARRVGSDPSSRYEYRGLRLASGGSGFVLSQSTAKIVMDSTKLFKIYGGSGTFTAYGYNHDIVNVTVSGHNLIVTANNLGNTTITVKDNEMENEERIDITVEPDIKIFYIYDMPIKMVRVKGGTFTMGGTAEQGSDAASNEKPTHQVTLRDFYISQTEITQEQWKRIMGYNYSYFSPTYGYLENLQRPVENVSWQECLTFINTLRRITRKTYDLPTEAQWEYAARGGIKSKGYKYSGSNTIDEVAWYYNNIPSQTPSSNSCGTQTVATKKPNELGIYDMSGNVNEWCQDWYGSYSSASQYEPTGPSTAALKVLRGGNWSSPKINCRIPFRGYDSPSSKNSLTGLRIVLENE